MVRKLVKAENNTSHVQCSRAVLNLQPPQREKGKKQTLQGSLTILGLISSSSSPHFVLHNCVLKFFLSCPLVLLLLYAGSCLPLVVLFQTAGRTHSRETEWVEMCSWIVCEPSRVKVNDCLFRIVTPAPLCLVNSAYLFSPYKKATPSYCSTQAHYSERLSHFVGLGVSKLSSCYSLFLPLACFTPPSFLKPWKGCWNYAHSLFGGGLTTGSQSGCF